MSVISKDDLRKEIDGGWHYFFERFYFEKSEQCVCLLKHAGYTVVCQFIKNLVLGILEGADLDTLSSKKVRQQLEEKLKFDLTDR